MKFSFGDLQGFFQLISKAAKAIQAQETEIAEVVEDVLEIKDDILSVTDKSISIVLEAIEEYNDSSTRAINEYGMIGFVTQKVNEKLPDWKMPF